jgi:hypothetical protein
MNSARNIKLRLKAPKPRNPVAPRAMQRKAGKHQKSNKALRSILKRQARQEMGL